MTHKSSPHTNGLQWTTAGESHGPTLVAVLEGLPAGLPIDFEAVQRGMMRRWEAYGRGKRADFEKDALSVLSGMKKGVTLGSPLTLGIGNADQKIDELPNLAAPRPGHVDLAGVQRN
ncbi:MAG: chorismate synthase, partial [Planctomycetota bacterium]|nr:chorismate synthase [Planctomycetota bacterium]